MSEKLTWNQISEQENKTQQEQRLLNEAKLAEEKRRHAQRDPVIRPDHSLTLNYPAELSRNGAREEWCARIPVFPDLENWGPASYKMSDIQPCLAAEEGKVDIIPGYQVWEYLRKNNLLNSCLGLRDALAINRDAPDIARRLFDGKPLPLWKTVMRHEEKLFERKYLTVMVVKKWCGEEGMEIDLKIIERVNTKTGEAEHDGPYMDIPIDQVTALHVPRDKSPTVAHHSEGGTGLDVGWYEGKQFCCDPEEFHKLKAHDEYLLTPEGQEWVREENTRHFNLHNYDDGD